MIFFFWFVFLCPKARHANLVPWAGVEPAPPAVEALNLTEWTAREVPIKNVIYIMFDRKKVTMWSSMWSLSTWYKEYHKQLPNRHNFFHPGQWGQGEEAPGICWVFHAPYRCSLLRHTGFSCGGAQALEHTGTVTCGLWAYLLYRMWELSSSTRNQTWVPCITR